MKILRLAILFCLIFALTGCASRIVKIERPNTPFERSGYTILSPQGDGWLFWEYDDTGQHVLSFNKPQKEIDHTLYANVKEVHSRANFEKPEDFLNFFKKAMQVGFDPRRFNVLEEEIKLENKFGKFTIAHYSKIEDHGAVQRSDVPYLIMEIKSCYFVHPFMENVIVDVTYSERARRSDLNPNFKQNAMDFINGLKIKEK